MALPETYLEGPGWTLDACDHFADQGAVPESSAFFELEFELERASMKAHVWTTTTGAVRKAKTERAMVRMLRQLSLVLQNVAAQVEEKSFADGGFRPVGVLASGPHGKSE